MGSGAVLSVEGVDGAGVGPVEDEAGRLVEVGPQAAVVVEPPPGGGREDEVAGAAAAQVLQGGDGFGAVGRVVAGPAAVGGAGEVPADAAVDVGQAVVAPADDGQHRAGGNDGPHQGPDPVDQTGVVGRVEGRLGGDRPILDGAGFTVAGAVAGRGLAL